MGLYVWCSTHTVPRIPYIGTYNVLDLYEILLLMISIYTHLDFTDRLLVADTDSS